MLINITGNHINLDDSIRQGVQDKFIKLQSVSQRGHKDTDMVTAHIIITKHKQSGAQTFSVKATITYPRKRFYAAGNGSTILEGANDAYHKLFSQIDKFDKKHIKKRVHPHQTSKDLLI